MRALIAFIHGILFAVGVTRINECHLVRDEAGAIVGQACQPVFVIAKYL